MSNEDKKRNITKVLKSKVLWLGVIFLVAVLAIAILTYRKDTNKDLKIDLSKGQPETELVFYKYKPTALLDTNQAAKLIKDDKLLKEKSSGFAAGVKDFFSSRDVLFEMKGSLKLAVDFKNHSDKIKMDVSPKNNTITKEEIKEGKYPVYTFTIPKEAVVVIYAKEDSVPHTMDKGVLTTVSDFANGHQKGMKLLNKLDKAYKYEIEKETKKNLLSNKETKEIYEQAIAGAIQSVYKDENVKVVVKLTEK